MSGRGVNHFRRRKTTPKTTALAAGHVGNEDALSLSLSLAMLGGGTAEDVAVGFNFDENGRRRTEPKWRRRYFQPTPFHGRRHLGSLLLLLLRLRLRHRPLRIDFFTHRRRRVVVPLRFCFALGRRVARGDVVCCARRSFSERPVSANAPGTSIFRCWNFSLTLSLSLSLSLSRTLLANRRPLPDRVCVCVCVCVLTSAHTHTHTHTWTRRLNLVP